MLAVTPQPVDAALAARAIDELAAMAEAGQTTAATARLWRVIGQEPARVAS